MVRIARPLALQSHPPAHRRAPPRRQPRRPRPLRRQSVSAAAAPDSRFALAILVYLHARKTRAGFVVATPIAGQLCANPRARCERPHHRRRVATRASAPPMTSPAQSTRACVVGAGPNGLAAAVTLAQRGVRIDVFEAQPQAGGAARTLELTLPGFLHDFGSAVHPLAAGSPFFTSLPLEAHGLQWIHSSAPPAPAFADGTAITLERDLRDAESVLGADGKRWRRLMQPFVERWSVLSAEILRPLHLLTPHPFFPAALRPHCFPFGKNTCASVPQRAHQGALRWSRRAFLPEPR